MSKKMSANHWNRKLSEEDVEKIKQDKRKQIEIAKDYKINQSHVSKIKNGLHNMYFAQEIQAKYWSYLTDEQINNIIADTRKQVDIAKDYNISQGSVSRIKNKKQYKNNA